MTKAQLLAQLTAKYPWVGTATLQDGAVYQDGSVTYAVPVKLIADPNGQPTAEITIVGIMVRNEGGVGEEAFYISSPPGDDAVQRGAFWAWIRAAVVANPDSYKGLILHLVDEVKEDAVYSRLDGAQLGRKFFFVKRGTAPVEITAALNIDHYRRDCRVWPRD